MILLRVDIDVVLGVVAVGEELLHSLQIAELARLYQLVVPHLGLLPGIIG